LFLSYCASHNPLFIENIYSNKVDKFIRETISIAAGIFPFSLAEILVIFSILGILYYITYIIVKFIKKGNSRKKIIVGFFINCFAIIGTIYLLFLVLWGFNYYRLQFSSIAKYDTHPASVKELGDLCEELVNRANVLRNKVMENNKGIMYIPGGRESVFSRVLYGYKPVSLIYPELSGTYGRPKGLILSIALSYAGISGIYFPFTGEPNLNIDLPDSLIPFTICHEMAHQRGFSREDEANFISYLVCSKHPDYDFQYSGTLLALINSINALSSYDTKRFNELNIKYSSGVLRDLQYINKFWDYYEGLIERISSNVNNAYLKANMQKEGIYSYGRMVDLLISERRARLKNKSI
jgi:hypothetical protein